MLVFSTTALGFSDKNLFNDAFSLSSPVRSAMNASRSEP